MKSSALKVLLLLGFIAASCSEKKVNYLDSDYPGLKPKIYAEGIINLEDRFQQNLSMTSDGREVYITETSGAEWRYERILRIKSTGEKIVTDTPKFSVDFKYEKVWFIGEPMLSADDSELFFVADYPPNLWRTVRMKNGDWGVPRKLPISTEKDDWYPTLSKRGTLYFTNGTGFSSPREGDGYRSKKKLTAPFNSVDLRDPVISPNEDYLIFSSRPNPEEDQSDLFVSFSINDSTWSDPVSLGDRVNTNQLEFAPYISPDEKYLFFSRRDRWTNAEASNIYWVSMQLIDSLRKL